MKKIYTTFLLSFMLLGQILYAQNVPNGMKYQAVARDQKGQVLADRNLELRISLYSDAVEREVNYTEVHNVVTNALGLFSLSVGEGKATKGSFEKIPWSTAEIWMEVAVLDEDADDFVVLSDTRMLSVPYAFHAATAGALSTDQGGIRGQTIPDSSIYWTIGGNKYTQPGKHKLGTTDAKDLVIVTNNLERMRVLSGGNINMVNSLNVGQDLGVGRKLTVANDALLNSAGGKTDILGNVRVENMSSTYLTGLLTVDKNTTLQEALNVYGVAKFANTTQSTTPVTGSVIVSGGQGILGNLNVGGNVNFGGSATFGGPLHITDLTQSTNTTTGALIVDGGVGIGKRLNVGEAVMLNSTLVVTGITSLKSTTQSTSTTTGGLVVDGGAGIAKRLNVGEATMLNSTLEVTGMTSVKSTIQSNTKDDGALLVEGGVGVEKNLNIGGTLGVKGTNTSFMASIENADPTNGDGLRIKLGKTHPRYDSNPVPPFSNYISAEIPGYEFLTTSVTQTKNLFKGLMVDPDSTFSIENFIAIGESFEAAMTTELGAPVETYASAACNLTKEILNKINTELSLPWDFPELTVPTIDIPKDFIALGLPPESIELVPEVTLTNSFEVFPVIPLPSCPTPPTLSSWSLPHFKIDNVPNSLGKQNQFIQFVDKDDRQVGTIRAESITEWCDRYLSLIYFLNTYNGFIGAWSIGVDPTQVIETEVKFAINGLTEVVNLAEAYNKIGVEYNSGFGDYAEWLERQDVEEPITPGDIVGVKGGKITRDLTGAEQVMAVSSNPIVLGNTPPAGLDHKGNKVAFMGQIPVKVMGPVNSGDFIVGAGNIPGYGVAVHPSAMTAADIEKAVGRSWESFPGPGPKLVNTVVGVHNGSFIHVLKQYETRLNENDTRLSAIEKQLGLLLPVASGN